MSEHLDRAAEIIGDMIKIAKGESPSEETPPYPFDLEFIVVSFNARPNSETPKIVSHKLRKPTLQQLKDRESQIKSELVSVSSREDEDVSDETAANANLWRKLIVEVKGYKGAEDWRAITDAEKDDMKPGHKSRAIAQMYMGSCTVEGGEDDDVEIGAETWVIRQEIGAGREPAFVVRHSLREPTSPEWEKFKGKALRVSHVRGAKRPRRKINTSLQSYCDLYDAVALSIDGGTVAGQPLGSNNRKAFLAQIDPIWKREIIAVLVATLEGQSSD